MDLVAVRLRDTVGAVARFLGYTSEYALNRALTRDRYIPPGRYRTYSRATQPPTPSAYPARPAPQKGPWRSAAGPTAVHVEGLPSDVAGGVGGQE
jgi:hypothetical protein